MSGTLYLIPSVLGASAISEVLPEATIAHARRLRYFAVETPKVARAFLKLLEVAAPIADLNLCEIPAAQISIGWLRAGNDVGVISDAGCPGVADPGAALVAAAHRAGIRVVPLVGPSSILLALMASGLNGQAFKFHGYLPSDVIGREAKLRVLDQSAKQSGEAQIFIETPYRNHAMIDSVLKIVHRDTIFCAARDLTCASELIVSQPINNWSAPQIEAMSTKAPTLFLLGRAAR